jgi:hypothetical protein
MKMSTNSVLKVLGVIAVVAIVVYIIDPTMLGLLSSRDGFEDKKAEKFEDKSGSEGFEDKKEDKSGSEGFENVPTPSAGMYAPMGSGYQDELLNYGAPAAEPAPAGFGDAVAPSGCYPRDQITPMELLPKDQNSVWAQQNPMGNGSLKGKNFLSAGALIGVNTVGQSLRNANLQLRAEPPAPQVPISVFNNSTIEPDLTRRPLDIA